MKFLVLNGDMVLLKGVGSSQAVKWKWEKQERRQLFEKFTKN